MAVWDYLLGSDASAGTIHRHQLTHPDVARAALRVLSDPDAGEGAQDLALSALRGANVAEVGEQDLVSLADRILDEGRAGRVSWLVEQVHEQRGLAPDFIMSLRDRLVNSEDAGVRVGGVTVGALLSRLDEQFAKRMFLDLSPVVRTAVADSLEAVSEADRSAALKLIRDQLRVEVHRSPLSALYSVLGILVRVGGRRVRPQELPGETH